MILLKMTTQILSHELGHSQHETVQTKKEFNTFNRH